MIRKIQYRLKWWWGDVRHFFGQQPDFLKRKGEVEVLCFHGVCEPNETLINGRFLQLDRFEALIVRLKKEFHLLSWDEFERQQWQPDRLNVLLTFDDGYRNNLTLALPVLEQYQVPAIVFVTARNDLPLWTDLLDMAMAHALDLSVLETYVGRVSGNQAFKQAIRSKSPEMIEQITCELMRLCAPVKTHSRNFWELLGTEELKTLAASPLITIGNHSANHYDLTTCSAQQQTDEVLACAQYLETNGVGDRSLFAFPYGAHSPELVELLSSLGYHRQFLSDSPGNPSIGVYRRMIIHPFISLHNQLNVISDGKY